MKRAEDNAVDGARSTDIVDRPAGQLCFRSLQLDDDTGRRVPLEHGTQAGDADPLAAERIAGHGRRRVGSEAVPRVDARELIRAACSDRPLRVRRALERVIVMNDDDTVARQMDVELDTVSAERQSMIERDHRVLRPKRRAATVGKDERPGQPGLRKLDQGPHLSRAPL